MKKEKTYIIVDLGILYHSNYHVMNRYSKPNELELANKICQSINSNYTYLQSLFDIENIIVCADSTSFRYSIHSNYKNKETKGHNDLGIDYDLVVEYIEERYIVLRKPLLEADDLCYITSRYIIGLSPKNFVILITNDSDYLSMAHKRIAIYSYKTREIHLNIDTKLEKIKRIFLGCKSDNLPKLIDKRGALVELIKVYSKNKEGKLQSIIDKITAIFNLNADSVELNKQLGIYDFSIYDMYIEEDFKRKIFEQLSSII